MPRQAQTGRGAYNARVITAERFAQGMTFDEYVRYIGTPENLAREAGWWLGPQRQDFSGLLRAWYARVDLTGVQKDAIRYLASHPGGPARVLVISEEWSSDCRRDVPMLARLAEAGGLELRIFTRDGAKVARGARANPQEQPNADIVNAFLNEQGGQTFQSVPVAAFFTTEMRLLHRYIEVPAIYHKERLFTAMQAARPGETREQAWDRFIRDWHALQQMSPFFLLWASAAADEIIAALHERLVVGTSDAV
jgi:hypothetical protein